MVLYIFFRKIVTKPPLLFELLSRPGPDGDRGCPSQVRTGYPMMGVPTWPGMDNPPRSARSELGGGGVFLGQVRMGDGKVQTGGYPSQGWGNPPPPIGQQMEYLICSSRNASCVHAGGLSCFILILIFKRLCTDDVLHDICFILKFFL